MLTLVIISAVKTKSGAGARMVQFSWIPVNGDLTELHKHSLVVYIIITVWTGQ